MKKVLTALFLTLVLLLSGCGITPGGGPTSPASTAPSASPSAAPSAAPSASSPQPTSADAGTVPAADYFPFKANVHMTYKGTGNEYAAFESWVDYIGNGAAQIRTNNGGTESVSVYTVENGAVKKVFSQGETYYRYDYTGTRTMDAVVLMDPIAVGTSWTDSDGFTSSITAVNVDVTVPYGTYKAVEVTTEETNSTLKNYYVAGIGLVKRVYTPNDDPAMTVTSELENFEEGSPLNQNARFFYPDFNNNRIAYIDKNLALYTGDGITSVFENAFKNVPSGSSLSPLMTAGASIRSITYDSGTGVATIDFTKSFVSDMNAGTSLESMILNSVADTLGHYFQTTKVQITVEGGPYESGHFLFNRGDFVPVQTEKAVEYKTP